VFALSGVVFAAAWASHGPVRAFRVAFLWAFALVLLTPWAGGYSPESAMINGAASGFTAASLWWVLERVARPRLPTASQPTVGAPNAAFGSRAMRLV
jgi:di/tricarboxylate transporter